MKRLFVAFLAASALTLGATSEAQAQFTFGPGLAYHDDYDLGIGVFFSTPMPSVHEQVNLWGSFGYFFPDEPPMVDRSYWELNGGLSYDFPTDASIIPYALAGLTIARSSRDGAGNDENDSSWTRLGLSLGGGLKAPLGDLVGLVGGRLEIRDGSGFVIEAGLGFPMGG